jgi:phosphatidate cytidylyltransferase
MTGDGLRTKSELSQRVISALVLAILAIGIAWLGGRTFALVWGVLAAAVAFEWGRIVDPARSEHLALAIAIGVLAAVILGLSVTVALGATIAVVAAAAAFATTHAGWMALGGLYAMALFISAVVLRGADGDGIAAILFLFAVVWCTDIGAYFAGRTFGGPKFAPAISPKKTWSGVGGGLVAGTIAGLAVLAAGGYEIRLWHTFLAILLGISVVFGDLFESYIKRRFGVKDAGTLIPGHGGFMDRLDGFIIAAALAAFIGILRADWDHAATGLLR